MSTISRPQNPEENPRVKSVFDDIRATRGSDFINNLWYYLAFDPELLERERSIFLAQAEESGKDASIMEKMVEGKVKRFLSEVTLVSQGFVKNPDQSIEELLKENNTSIISFARFKVGEGIEVEVKDFAAEVAEQLQQ